MFAAAVAQLVNGGDGFVLRTSTYRTAPAQLSSKNKTIVQVGSMYVVFNQMRLSLVLSLDRGNEPSALQSLIPQPGFTQGQRRGITGG
jgi:hypothetical protein